MQKLILNATILLLVTTLNLALFFRRWSDLPLSGIPGFLGEHSAASLFLGIILAAAALNFAGHIQGRRWLSSIMLCIACALFFSWIMRSKSLSSTFPLTVKFVVGGAILATFCLRIRENEPNQLKVIRLKSFALYTLGSFNFFLLIAPFTTFTPAFIQDGTSPAPSLSQFFYGSIHSNVSMVSVFMRKIINSVFDYPSINATMLSSMILVSTGLACVALSFELLFGALWGWMVLLVAWTDRYLLAGGIASSVVSMPIFSAGSVFLLCIWSLTRTRGMLGFGEAMALSAFNAISLLFSLYSYSAARMPWIAGSIIGATILVIRGAFPLSLAGMRRALSTLIPSVGVLAFILVFYFNSDVSKFKSQLFISPPKQNIIKDVASYPEKVMTGHDGDIPIWWGTGRVGTVNTNLYWRRTPREIYDKVLWFMGEIDRSSPMVPYLPVLSGLSFIVLLCSSHSLWRKFALISFLSLLGSFAPFILAQDPSAYRRALATNLFLLVPFVAVFAVRRRRGLWNFASAGLCATFCLVRAPLEWTPLLNDALHGPLCITCHDLFNVRAIINHPTYKGVQDRAISFILDGSGISVAYAQCAVMAIDSHEMKKLSPRARHIKVGDHTLQETLESLTPGGILVVTCPTSAATEGEMAAICADAPPFGKFLGSIKDPNNPYQPRTKWVFIEKVA